MIDPRDRERTLREARAQIAKGPAKELEYRMIRKDGAIVWMLDKGRLVRTEDGREAFNYFGARTPCAFCPVIRYEHDGTQITQLIQNTHLGVWGYVDVAPIRWKGEDAYLITSRELEGGKAPDGGRT